MKRMLGKRGHLQVREGAAVVETAIVFPLLLLMMFGIIQMGYFMYVRVMMMEACRRGCRAMIVVGKRSYATTVGRQAAQNYLVATFPASSAAYHFTYTPNPAPATTDSTNEWYMIDRMTISTTISAALQFPITGINDPPINAYYLMVHEGTVPIE